MTLIKEEPVDIVKTPSSNPRLAAQNESKDRSLFCINIDPKCTEDILYELFLQVILKQSLKS